ncbi:hypothetical protein FVE67_03260 [Thermosulfurimonas marina]|uniref:Nucleotidyltransferase family protein n=1 Tax=Thermosulfurimonas marina TaxID=2047767 RepID=A0A6H1WRM7_9BACT|nr:hypothetical protein [Thermosulfurimonas marina]QJA05875.1 hypothetical protein FVE67_03260 [Thermosulfurimonas marina]
MKTLDLFESSSHLVEDWALIGKLALAAQVEILPTIDLDFLVSFKDFEGLRRLLASLNFEIAVVELPEGKKLLRFWEKKDLVPVDLVEAKYPWEKDILQEALVLEVFGQKVKVARKEDILVLKLAHYRSFKDQTDLEILLRDPSLDHERVEHLARKAGVEEKWKRLKMQGSL